MSITIEGIRVTHDHLEELVQLFQRDVSSPRISDNSFEFESLDEFFSHRGSRPRKLEIESTSADSAAIYIRADFEDGHVSLRGTIDTPFQEAKDFLLALRPWSYRVFNPWIGVFATGILFPLVASMSEKPTDYNPQIIEIANVALYLSMGLLLGGTLYRKLAFGVTSARRRDGGIWSKHGDKIVGGVVGAIGTGLVQWAIRHFSSN